jgi:Zn-dependent peptidase ImmA (M78 family)
MPRRRTVPVTAAVVDWAIRESGFSLDELAAKLRVSPATLRAWAAGTEQPGLTQLRALASKLKRPLAAFLLPAPPALPPPEVAFRSPRDADRHELNPAERRFLRVAARLQRFLSWVAKELGERPVVLPPESIDADPEGAAARVRARLGVTLEQQEQWPSASAAFAAWRQAVENEGVLVFAFSLGRDSCRGFSLWDNHAPLVAVNTWWLPSARIFTLFHEYGHLVTRTSSACLQATRRWTSRAADAPERWCEVFAAAVLMPGDAVRRHVLQVRDRRPDALIKAVATHFSVSLRAAALRLVELKHITWDDYEALPPYEPKPKGGGKGRDRTQVREDQYGGRTTRLVGQALEREVIGRGDVLDYLDVPESAIDRFTGTPVGE